MQGASPLASPGAEPGQHWNREANHAPSVGLVSGVGGSTCRCGTRRGRVFSLPLPPAAFSFDSAPIPPPPLPGGKGEIFGFLMQGASPPAPRALDRLRHLQTLPNKYRAVPLAGNRFLSFCGEPWAQPRGCKGRSPLHEITLVTPFPAGEGGWGDRGHNSKLKAG